MCVCVFLVVVVVVVVRLFWFLFLLLLCFCLCWCSSVFGVALFWGGGGGYFCYCSFCYCLFCLFVLECFCCFKLFLLCFFVCFYFAICVCWSGFVCCSCLCFLVCFVILCCFACLCLFLSVSFQNTIFPAILVFFGLMLVQRLFLISVVGSCFLTLFVCFVLQDAVCACCPFALKHTMRFLSICFLFLVVFFLMFYFGMLLFLFLLSIKNTSPKIGYSETPQIENAEKKDILTRAVSTGGVLTNRLFLFF